MLINSSFSSPKTVVKIQKAEENTASACSHSPETKQSHKANNFWQTRLVCLKIKTVHFLSHKGLTDLCKHAREPALNRVLRTAGANGIFPPSSVSPDTETF